MEKTYLIKVLNLKWVGKLFRIQIRISTINTGSNAAISLTSTNNFTWLTPIISNSWYKTKVIICVPYPIWSDKIITKMKKCYNYWKYSTTTIYHNLIKDLWLICTNSMQQRKQSRDWVGKVLNSSSILQIIGLISWVIRNWLIKLSIWALQTSSKSNLWYSKSSLPRTSCTEDS